MHAKLRLSLLSEDHRFSVCENQMPRRMFALKREDVTEEPRKIKSIYRYTVLVDLARFFSFLIYTQSVGLL
jgi:hypothetical protein